MNKIVVIGSSNTDMVVRSEHLPRPGESVLGGDFMMAGGGKGANQAIAVARMGHNVIFSAAVGRDMFGDAAVAGYQRFGVDTSYIVRKDTPSGIALIMVDGAGQNSISVALGANNCLTAEDVMPALESVSAGDIVLLQFDGITYQADVVFTGQNLGTMYPYSEYKYDITHIVKEKDNRLLVLLEDMTPAFGPTEGWENYGGIIRGVRLDVVPDAYIDDIYFRNRIVLHESYRLRFLIHSLQHVSI